MADFVQGLDPGKLVLSGAALSFVLSPFAAPAYNLPIFLFGALVHESSDAVQSLKLFSGVLSASIFSDLVWVFNNDQGGFTKFLFFLLWLLKARWSSRLFPTAAAFLATLRQRGSQFMGLGADVSGPTVWSMPGGFTSGGREGYQVVDDEPRTTSVPRGPPPPPKTTVVAPTPQPAPGIQPGNYQKRVINAERPSGDRCRVTRSPRVASFTEIMPFFFFFFWFCPRFFAHIESPE
ncbi:hypothetical protein HD554DRAFT_2314505 [Boletus coccyginus]|nr:hypothetical protein HD554DRAFT_2314505 [Boletus coccyginus]